MTDREISAAVRDGGPGRDAVADMHWALETSPPDFLAMVRLVQRAGPLVIHLRAPGSLRTPLHLSALYGKVAYAAMLVARGADKEARDSSAWTPLMSAAFGAVAAGQTGVATARLLLACGANVHACCSLGTQSLHIAAAYGTTTELAEMLLAKGATIDARDGNGETPLHKAALSGWLGMVKFLIEEHRADPNATSNAGETPSDLASRETAEQHAAVIQYLTSRS
jgi:ankyrin repeat protein